MTYKDRVHRSLEERRCSLNLDNVLCCERDVERSYICVQVLDLASADDGKYVRGFLHHVCDCHLEANVASTLFHKFGYTCGSPAWMHGALTSVAISSRTLATARSLSVRSIRPEARPSRLQLSSRDFLCGCVAYLSPQFHAVFLLPYRSEFSPQLGRSTARGPCPLPAPSV